MDAAGNDSAWSGTDDPATFSATADPDVTYSSFADALNAGQSFDNTMISSSASDSGTADADGNDNAFSEAELKDAGWQPGGTATIDGAAFTLPDFGTGGPDNILAANQTIDLPPGSEGTSLVFLATSSNGDAASPDAGSLEQDQQNAQGAGATLVTAAPYVPGGSAVTGYECDTAGTGAGDCALPTGAVTYASGAQESYGLTVPNWVSGPTASAAMVTPDRLSPVKVLTGQESKIYAFAVPLAPGEPVTSVSLPDIGSVLSVGGVSYPALHILGVAVANTTTATPGSGTALASGQTWTGAWASPTEGAYAPLTGSTFGDQTFRIAMQAELDQLACGGESFTPATRVLLASGRTVPIADLKPGDKVLATSTKTGKTRPETVTEVLVHHDTDLYNLTVKTSGGTEVIHTTSSHLFWDPSPHQGWIPANHLKSGMHLMAPDGQSAVVVGGSVPPVHDGWMWDLTVPGNNDHDFYVVVVGGRNASGAVLVHNEDGCLPGVGDVPRKVVNSNMGHIDEERAARAGFDTVQSAQAAVRQLGESIGTDGFPEGTIPDTARSDRLLVPFGDNGYAVYQIAKNGNAVFKTILIAR